MDVLTLEHAIIKKETSSLLSLADLLRHDGRDFDARVAKLLRFLEYHQEAEERFLFPLLSEPADERFDELRHEHSRFLGSYDGLTDHTKGRKESDALELLTELSTELNAHFSREEADIFPKASEVLSAAQLDILKVKFASRKPFVL